MWSRRLLAGAALATLLSCPAHAQIEDSWLEQVDPWGISYLEDDEPALRTRMWRGARGEDLLVLMQPVFVALDCRCQKAFWTFMAGSVHFL